MKIYLSSGFFTPETREKVKMVARALRLMGHEVYVPMEHEVENAWDLQHTVWAREVFKADVKAMDECDKLVVLDFGANGDCGTAWECGYAYAKGIPYEVRSYADDISIMVYCGAKSTEKSGRKDLKLV